MYTEKDITTIYDTNFTKVYRFFYYKFMSQDIAEDLTSDTFLELIKQIKEKPESIEDPTKYLFGIAKNIYLQHLHKKYHQIQTQDIESEQEFGSTVDHFLEEVDDSPTLEDLAIKFIVKLPGKQQEIAKLRFIDKLSLSEICVKLEKNMNYVKTTQKRAIKSLKDIVASENFAKINITNQ